MDALHDQRFGIKNPVLWLKKDHSAGLFCRWLS